MHFLSLFLKLVNLTSKLDVILISPLAQIFDKLIVLLDTVFEVFRRSSLRCQLPDFLVFLTYCFIFADYQCFESVKFFLANLTLMLVLPQLTF